MREQIRENIQLILGSLGVLMFLVFNAGNAYSAIPTLSCETNFGEKSFTIEDNTVAFHQDSESGRSISSVTDAKSQRTHQGFRKTMYIKGVKHFISIQNIKRLSNTEDFLAVTSPKGHKMTYPINCNVVE